VTHNITIIDTKSANLVSVKNAFEYIGHTVTVSKDPEIILKSSHLVLPGVGAFDACLEAIDGAGLRDTIITLAINEYMPILGICVGMQVLFEGSEEGTSKGLGLLKGKCVALQPNLIASHKVPHNGFAEVKFSPSTVLKKGLRETEAFYFNHSYGISYIHESAEVDLVQHTQSIVASFQLNNIFGIQFHPEKSQRIGLKVLSNFVRFSGQY
jgi:glutamine amidotransferase